MRVLRINGLVLMVLFLVVGGAYTQTVEEYYDKGIEYASKGQFKEARKELKKALEINKFDSNSQQTLKIIDDFDKGILNEEHILHLIRGLSYLVDKQYMLAIIKIEETTQINPNYATQYVLLSSIYNQFLDQYQKAITYSQKALQINPNDAIAYHNLGFAYNSLGQPQQAITYLQKAVQIDPDLFQSYFNLGDAYASLNQRQQAIDNFKKALEINPNLAEACYGLGFAYNSWGQPQQAITYLQKAIEINPNFIRAYNELSFTYNSLGEYQKAITYSQKALQINPNDAAANNNLGMAYVSLGQPQQAINYLQKAVQINSNYGEAYFNLAAAYASLNKYKEAKKELLNAKVVFQTKRDYQNVQKVEEFLKEPPFQEKGVEYISEEEYKEIEKQLKKSLELDKSDDFRQQYLKITDDLNKKIISKEYVFYFFKGTDYLLNRHYEQAIPELKKAIEVNPHYAEAYGNLASAFVLMGRPHEAEIYYQKAFELNPDDYPADNFYNSLGTSYWMLMDYDNAIIYFKKALQDNANSAHAYFGLGLAYHSLGQIKNEKENYRNAKENLQKAKELFQSKGDYQSIQEIEEYLQEIEEYLNKAP